MEPLFKFVRRETPHGFAMSGRYLFSSLYYIEMLFTMTR